MISSPSVSTAEPPPVSTQSSIPSPSESMLSGSVPRIISTASVMPSPSVSASRSGTVGSAPISSSTGTPPASSKQAMSALRAWVLLDVPAHSTIGSLGSMPAACMSARGMANVRNQSTSPSKLESASIACQWSSGGDRTWGVPSASSPGLLRPCWIVFSVHVTSSLPVPSAMYRYSYVLSPPSLSTSKPQPKDLRFSVAWTGSSSMRMRRYALTPSDAWYMAG